jgi:hypothetical protein
MNTSTDVIEYLSRKAETDNVDVIYRMIEEIGLETILEDMKAEQKNKTEAS